MVYDLLYPTVELELHFCNKDGIGEMHDYFFIEIDNKIEKKERILLLSSFQYPEIHHAASLSSTYYYNGN